MRGTQSEAKRTSLVGVVGTVDRVAGAEKAFWAISNGLRERLDLDLVQISQLEPREPLGDDRQLHYLRSEGDHFGVGQILRLRGILKHVRRPAILFSFQMNSNILSIVANLLLPPRLRLPMIINDRANIRTVTTPTLEFGWTWALRISAVRVLARFCYPRAQEIVCNSEANGLQVREFIASESPPISVIYNPVAVAEIQARFPGRDRSDFIQAGSPRIVGHGRLHRGKGWKVLIRSFARVCAVFPVAILRLVGEGQQRSELEALAREIGVADQCEFLGHSGDPLQEVESGDVYVLASRSEGMPNSLLEAIALGLPCVSTDCPTGPSEILGRDGSIGRLVPVGDCEILAREILELLSDGNLRNELGRAARRRALDFRPSNCIDGYEKVIRKYLP